MAQVVQTVFTQEELQTLLQLAEVLEAKTKLSTSNTVSFSILLTESIRQALLQAFQLALPDISSIPCRWIKGDTAPHVDTGQSSFEHTYLVYLTDNQGTFSIGEESYPITAGTGYSFSEGIEHQVLGTDTTPRLLLGPMSEQGFAVGSSLTFAGGTIVYIRQDGSNVQYSTNQTSWTTISFSCNVSNSSPANGFVKLYFTTDITINTSQGYFSCLTDKIQFGNENLNADGSRPTITLTVDNYDGFIFNGDSDFNGKNNICVYNLIIDGTGKTTQVGGGWLVHQYFGKGASNNYIINCSSKGNIGSYGGGILARFAGTSGGSVTVIGCSSTGSIADAGGGIVGASSANVTCEQCFSTGTINQNSGGIFGQETNGSCSATKCYSTGSIGIGAGGIVGAVAGNGFTVSKCYSSGNIGQSAGGIYGCQAAANGGEVAVATNCYSTGTVGGGSAGGIYGNPFSVNGTRTESNCYKLEGGSWSDATANTNLTGTPSSSPGAGTTWVSTASNTAYELADFGYTPYDALVITSNTLVQSKSGTVTGGQSSSAGLVSASNSYSILQTSGGDSGSYATITINSTTGAISTTTATVAGTYTVTVRRTGSYFITSYVLSVTGYIPPTPSSGGSTTTKACCASTIDERGIDYAQIVDYKIGNRLILEHQQNPNQKFDGYSQFLKYKMAQGSRKY